MHAQDVKISQYDKNQISALAIGAIGELQEWGFHARYIERACQEAFQLGFTAVNRGEADGQEHPPKPEWMTQEDEEAPSVNNVSIDVEATDTGEAK